MHGKTDLFLSKSSCETLMGLGKREVNLCTPHHHNFA